MHLFIQLLIFSNINNIDWFPKWLYIDYRSYSVIVSEMISSGEIIHRLFDYFHLKMHQLPDTVDDCNWNERVILK